MKNKKVILILTITLVIISIAYLMIGNPVILFHNNQLKKAVTAAGDKETITLNEVIPFDWDVVYTFPPYTSKSEIEQIIGFSSTDIEENYINEGIVHLLFVKDKKVVLSILGYSENLGYDIDFPSKVTFAENALFNVSNSNGIVILTYEK